MNLMFYIKYIVVAIILVSVGLLLDYLFMVVLRNILQERYKYVAYPKLHTFFFFLSLFFLSDYLCSVL
jgi:hypothetical protein